MNIFEKTDPPVRIILFAWLVISLVIFLSRT
jgi:hypothetical protein